MHIYTCTNERTKNARKTYSNERHRGKRRQQHMTKTW